MAGKKGWKFKPVVLWKTNLNLLQSSLKQDPTPRLKGDLRRAFVLGGDFGLSANKPGSGVVIRNIMIYSRIQDIGGNIPARTAKGQPFQVMHYFAYGKEWWIRKVKGFRMNPHWYTRAAVNRWLRDPSSIRVDWGRVGTQTNL